MPLSEFDSSPLASGVDKWDSPIPGPSTMSTDPQNLTTMPDIQEPQNTEMIPNFQEPPTHCQSPEPELHSPVTPKTSRSPMSASH